MEGEGFDTFARAALARMGVEVDDVDLAVMRVAEAVYGPDRDALMAADLSGIAREHDFDPSRPPSDAGRGLRRRA
jgi:hypothetical protein